MVEGQNNQHFHQSQQALIPQKNVDNSPTANIFKRLNNNMISKMYATNVNFIGDSLD
jgi:hypothetical protein